MANKEIGELAAASLPLAGTEMIHLVQSDNSRKATVMDILTHPDLPYLACQVGDYLLIDTSVDGIPIPPTDHPDYRFVLCTAGEDGSGDYNEGILVNEDITGSGATLVATAEVALAGSIFDGEVIHLVNTEERTLYFGEAAGTAFDDQGQAIVGALPKNGIDGIWATVSNNSGTGALQINNTNGLTNRGATGSAGSTFEVSFNSANSPGARTGDRTRAKGITMVAYRRIK